MSPISLQDLSGNQFPIFDWSSHIQRGDFKELAIKQYPDELGGPNCQWAVQVGEEAEEPTYKPDLRVITRQLMRGQLSLEIPWLVVFLGEEDLDGSEGGGIGPSSAK